MATKKPTFLLRFPTQEAYDHVAEGAREHGKSVQQFILDMILPGPYEVSSGGVMQVYMPEDDMVGSGADELVIEQLKDRFALKTASELAVPAAEVPSDSKCGKTWWEDGTEYQCLMPKGHKETKHGMRGMVRKLEDW